MSEPGKELGKASIEDQIEKKLNLSGLSGKDQVVAVLNYFISILRGENRTSPIEFKTLLTVMYNKLALDSEGSITKYILTHEATIQAFFYKNFQRFDYYECEPYLMRLKGEVHADRFKVPIFAQRNFEKVEALDIRPYMEILETDSAQLEVKRASTKVINSDLLQEEKNNIEKEIEEKIKTICAQIKENISKGFLTKEKLLSALQFAQAVCVPALQIKYNNQALDELKNLLTEQKSTPVNKIFDSLKLPMKQRVKFCEVLNKKIA